MSDFFVNVITKLVIFAWFAIWVIAIVGSLRKRKNKKAAHNSHNPGHMHAGPRYNVNGLPMIGAVDVSGNPYGTTDASMGNHQDNF